MSTEKRHYSLIRKKDPGLHRGRVSKGNDTYHFLCACWHEAGITATKFHDCMQTRYDSLKSQILSAWANCLAREIWCFFTFSITFFLHTVCIYCPTHKNRRPSHNHASVFFRHYNLKFSMQSPCTHLITVWKKVPEITGVCGESI